VTIKVGEVYVPTAPPDVGIVSLPPTDSILGVVAELFELVKVPTVILTPPAAMLTDVVIVTVYVHEALLQPTLNWAGLPLLLLDRTMPGVAVRVPSGFMVILQLTHDGKTTKVPKSKFWAGATVILSAAACAACGASSKASIGARHICKEMGPGPHFFCVRVVLDMGSY
jgi:hypothetical protein